MWGLITCYDPLNPNFFISRRLFLPPANEVWLGQANIFTGVCLSTGWGCILVLSPGGGPLGPGDTHPSWTQPPLWTYTYTHTPWTPPPRSTSGRYTSYWNAFSFVIFFLWRGGGGSIDYEISLSGIYNTLTFWIVILCFKRILCVS